jgi:hypothetical protein
MQAVEQALRDLRHKYKLQMQTYRSSMALYRVQLPMEELRLRLLADAGDMPPFHSLHDSSDPHHRACSLCQHHEAMG